MHQMIPAVKTLVASLTARKATTVATALFPVDKMSKQYSTVAEYEFDVKPFQLHKLDAGPAVKTVLTNSEALKIYENLAVIRRLEAAGDELYRGKFVRGFLHLYTGQEAVAVGIKSIMRPQDTVITSYRCHAWTYLMSGSAVNVLAELTGRQSGCARGKGGSMHMYAPNFYGGNGIVGGHVPLGTGLAFAHKYKGDKGVCFTLYGDGAANQGQVFEAFNIAKLLSLPCVYICENNQYAMGTAAHRSSASTQYYTRGDYIPGIWVDGMDVFATREATKFAIDWITKGNGPILLEMDTYRYYGHSMSDPGLAYRSREEVQLVRKTRDPINAFKKKIIDAKLVAPEQLKEIDGKVKKQIEAAAAQAKSDTVIGVEELYADVYSLWPYDNEQIRGLLPTHLHKHTHVKI